ncbi:fimbrial protein [Pseudomonas sp. B329]|uniref:fimbrial protein n=1 Tax=Pseudomonas sp. B329 TaxID=1553459 RepID=UPI002005150D|nr:fimbrial protein [Pseudomonas sp. B329]
MNLFNVWRLCLMLPRGAACLLMLWVAIEARAAVNSVATFCTFTNGTGRPWVQVTPLTSTTPVGSVLWERGVGLNINYAYTGPAGTAHELVSAGHWGPGTPLSDGVAPTNIDGIGLKVGVGSSDGQRRTLLQTPLPVAVEKEPVQYDSAASQARGSALTTNYVQQLILTVAPSQLPAGKLIVDRVAGSSQLTLYAVDLLKGQVGFGSSVEIPLDNRPSGVCRVPYLLMGPAIINMGDGGGPIEVPNTCNVQTYQTIPVKLGRISLNEFPQVGSTSRPTHFAIELSDCAVNAKPEITFNDKYGPPADPTVLTLEPTAASAQGFGIVMTNELTRQAVRYDGVSYAMKRAGEGAKIPLSAQYVRVGSGEVLKAGAANGVAEFTFTFP